jgi:uncharacterized protein YdeI (YjbR/CyaY-like superfamily)
MVPDPTRIRTFPSQARFESWLRRNHAREPELWLRVYKKGSGTKSITTAEALDVALCWGWIDGIRKAFDDASFLQRYTPRRKKSLWSQVNRDHVARLLAAGRMQPPGLQAVEAARADGRWDAAYAPMRMVTIDSLPADLLAAIRRNRRAMATLHTLNRQNLMALSFRTSSMKSADGRARRIAGFVRLLASGHSILP